MSQVEIVRSPEVIAAEIMGIKHQTKMVLLQNSVEIGRRLVEAKEQLQHGQWATWLSESVDYSHSTANNLMNFYREYGDKIATFGNLPQAKALALLGVPAEEREEFLQQHDPDGDKSARELKKLIDEKKLLEKRAQEAEQAAEKEREAREALERQQQEIENQQQEQAAAVELLKAQLEEAKTSGNEDEVVQLQEQLDKSRHELSESRSKIRDLENQLKEKPIDVTAFIEKIPEEVEVELAELRKKAAQHNNDKSAIKFKVLFESLSGTFKELLGTIDEIPADDRQKYKGAVNGLIDRMAANLK